MLWAGTEGWNKLIVEINDELLEKWEPKVQKFLQTSFVLGMDRED